MAAVDLWATYGTGCPMHPGEILPITPSDTEDLEYVSRAVVVVTAGIVKYLNKDGAVRTVSLPVGVIVVRARRVYSSVTTAVLGGYVP